jgi:exopolysaccharide biosynthesis protein
VLSINGSSTRIDVLHRGDAPPAGSRLDSLSAGPNLVTTNESGTFINIPSDDDNIGNILEHSANTAFGLTDDARALLVTVDGFDGCPLLNASCGINAFSIAYLMRDHFGVSSAMAMDQGGSTTMWVKGAGIVSRSGGGPRPIFAGLFISEQ